VRELAVVHVPVLALALLATEVGGAATDDLFYYVLAGAGLYSAALLWLAFVRGGAALPWFTYVAVDIVVLSALLYTSGGGDSPVRPLFILLPLVGVLSYSSSWTALVGGVAALDYLVVASVHSAAEAGPGFGEILTFSLFIAVGTLGAALPVQAVVERGRARAELEQRAELLREQAARAEAEAMAETVAKLQRITDITLTHLSLDELLPAVLRSILEAVRAQAGAILLADDDRGLRASCTIGLTAVDREARLEAGEGFPARVARAREPLAASPSAEGDRLSRAFEAAGVASLVGVPLMADDRLVGILVVGTHEDLGRVETDLLRLQGDRVALSIQRARLYDRERVVAQTLQRTLLPERLPEVPGLEVAARYVPAREHAKVGGDWYDVFVLDEAAVGLAMGDVVSHGIRAASVMGQVRSTLRAYALDGEGPGTTLTKLNRIVRSLDQSETVTAVYLALDLERGTVTVASAGHPPPLLIAPGGDAQFLEEVGSVPLGAHATSRYEESVARLEAGSTILLYTDGLVERRDISLDERLAQLASEASADFEEPESLCTRLIDALVGAEAPADDVALMAAHVAPLPQERLALELPCSPTTLAPLRRILRQWLAPVGASPLELQDILVAAGEAASNAVEHAYGPGQATYSVEGRLSGERVVITVRDSGSWRERRRGERGRGTELMRELMDAFEVYSSQRGTTVRLERRLDSRGAA
jgi:serine phosphatase RsbU (regulator of sigma subunit)/anti-sigma regulatory factor (Ser/Thr protein kinase)